MTVKMKFVNIMGPCADIDRVKEKYISKYDIQLEDAVREASGNQTGLSFFTVDNPLVDTLKEVERLSRIVGVNENYGNKIVTIDEAVQIVEDLRLTIDDSDKKIEELMKEKNHFSDLKVQINPFTSLEFPIERMLDFNFIRFRFGCIPTSNFSQFETYLHNQPEMFFVKSYSDKDFVWGVYFVPTTIHEKVDAIFSSLYFRRVRISDEFTGTPLSAYVDANRKEADIDHEIEAQNALQTEKLAEKRDDVAAALRKIREFYDYNEMQKYVAKTKNDFYIIVGWMTEKDALSLERDTANDKDVIIMIEDASSDLTSTPPTKLSNIALFRPFEFFVKMYSLPAHDEIDPTPFFGITYSILFGMMFGDLGHGLLLSLFGYALYKIKKSQLGAILGIVGISSAIFGSLYGSVLGYEHILPALWLNPMENTNVILLTAVAFGMSLNIIAMVLHVINAFKAKNYGSMIFDSNGFSGIIFYGLAIYVAVCFFLKIPLKHSGLLILLLVLPIILITLKKPLTNIITHQPEMRKDSMGEYIMETFFETFEVLLTYVTNTISFVRVGAFALCHAGMMSVVMMLAGVTENGSGNVFVIIMGNLLVMALEGLIVAIQVLRLQYYEMFSRFFKGGGKEFKSYKSVRNKTL